MKNNIHKKMTVEDKFGRHSWYFWRKKARKDFRRRAKKLLDENF
jgi:S-formylglutathione hydrolase FrmB